MSFERNLSILHSTNLEQANSFIFIKKDHGAISNQILDDLLSNGVPVPRLKIIKEITQMKFYDSEPPIIYTMMIIWDFILKNFIDVKQSRELSINKTVKLSLTVQQVHDKLSRFCPETNSSCLEMSWVKKALMGFVEIGIASSQADNKEFQINFKKHKGETIDWIFRSISNSSLIEKSHSTLDEFLRKS
jgi:hypothetical protein